MTSVAICLSFKDFESLEERAEVLEEALENLDKRHLPKKQSGTSGNVLGSTLMAFTNGEKIVREARQHRSQLKNT